MLLSFLLLDLILAVASEVMVCDVLPSVENKSIATSETSSFFLKDNNKGDKGEIGKDGKKGEKGEGISPVLVKNVNELENKIRGLNKFCKMRNLNQDSSIKIVWLVYERKNCT